MARRAVTQEEVFRALTLRREGRPTRSIARLLGRTQSVVQRIFNRHDTYGLTGRRPGQGRKRMTTPREDRRIRLAAVQNPHVKAREIAVQHTAATNQPISGQTIRNRLREGGLQARRPHKVMPLTAQHRITRRRYAERHIQWTLRKWRTVCFSDETRICLEGNDNSERVYRRHKERYQPSKSKKNFRTVPGPSCVGLPLATISGLLLCFSHLQE